MQKRYLASGLLLVMVSIAAVNFYLPSTTGKFAESKKITASLLIDYGLNTRNTTIELRSGASAFDALSAAAEIGYKEYEGLGKLITSIDNLSQNSTHYWLYFVNGKFAEVSADNYMFYEDANVTFSLLSMSEMKVLEGE